jgi:hypothetical protein
MAFKSKQKTASQAIRDFNVPCQTFYDRLNAKPPRNLAHEKDQLLTHIQEKELVQWITRLSITGYPPQHATLIKIADIIRRKRHPVTLEPTTKHEQLRDNRRSMDSTLPLLSPRIVRCSNATIFT